MSSQWKITHLRGFFLENSLRRLPLSPWHTVGLHPAVAGFKCQVEQLFLKKNEGKVRESGSDRTVCPSAVDSFLFIYLFFNLTWVWVCFASTFSGISAALSKLTVWWITRWGSVGPVCVGVWPQALRAEKETSLKKREPRGLVFHYQQSRSFKIFHQSWQTSDKRQTAGLNIWTPQCWNR